MSLTVFKSCDVGFAEESVGHGTWKSASEDEKRNGVLCGRFKNLCISFIFDQDMSEVANQNEILIFQDSLKKTLDKDCTLILTGKELIILDTLLSSGIAIKYPSIMLHAISPVSEADSVDGRAILRTVYLQLSATKAVIKGADLSEQIILLVDSNADEDEESFFFEMQLKPQSDSEAEKIYEALCECSSLNHDDCSDDSEQDLDSDGDRDDVEELAGASVLIAEDEVEKDAGHQINSDVGEESNFKYENDTTPSTDSGVEKRRKIESDEPEK